MVRCRLLALVLAAACNSAPDAGAPAAEPPLPDTAFARSWVFLDRIAPDRPFDAVIRTGSGFVAITHAPTADGKANPERNDIAATSPDGLTWEQHPLGDTVHARALAMGNGIIVAVGQRFGAGSRGSILTSTDGKTWTEGAGTNIGLMALKFVQGRFWAFGEQGAFFTSSDGKSWADQSRPASVQLNDLAYGQGRYVVVGNVSWLSSTDGRTWSEQRSICGETARCPGVLPPGGAGPGALALFSVLFGNGTFVTSGGVGGWASSDGLTWSEAPGAPGGGVFSGGRFLARADVRHTVVVSEDGRTWRDRTTFLVTDGNTLSCADHTCIVLPDGILIVPTLADVLPPARPPVLELANSQSGATVTASPGQTINLSLQTIGPGQYGDPELSSPAVRLLTAGFSGGPFNPGGPVQLFQFVAESPGHAELRIPHTEMGPTFQLTIDVTM